mmetsp:Transcript_14062/g.35234  ORF Transcript_14062/g.35234 Transcript_14062/m.35234 type:complete len:517 (-) Transcript_14062:199-1749(-)
MMLPTMMKTSVNGKAHGPKAVRRSGPSQSRTVRTRAAPPPTQGTWDEDSLSSETEINMLQAMLAKAVQRKELELNAPADADANGANGSNGYSGPSFTVKTFNAISPVGLDRFPKGKYSVAGNDDALPDSPMAIMLRSHKLQNDEVASTVRCIVRCGAGTNNIPVSEMTERGIPVFNTPGANANAVKELVLCALFLAARGIVEGIAHTKDVINVEEKGDYTAISKRIEADKKMFVGSELTGKTLGIIGLGHIGGKVVEAALALGMKVVGYDPVLNVESALRLPGDRMQRVNTLDEVWAQCDYVSLHVPYIPDITHHLINADTLAKSKRNLCILNFARGEIVDGAALKSAWDSGAITGKYMSDFADPYLLGQDKHIVMPHLGASTAEAEDNSAAMAADTVMNYLETGSIVNSVNFPHCELPVAENGYRISIAHKNSTGVLGEITTYLGGKSFNITQQLNVSRGDIAYTVLDLDSDPKDPEDIQSGLFDACDAILSMRFLGHPFDNKFGAPGTFFYTRN